MTSGHAMNAGPELAEDVFACFTADLRPKISQSSRDGVRPIWAVSVSSNSRRGEYPEQIRGVEFVLARIVACDKEPGNSVAGSPKETVTR